MVDLRNPIGVFVMTITLNTNNGPEIAGVTTRTKLSSIHGKFVLDGTGSTGPFNAGIKAIIQDMVTELPRRVGQCVFGLHVGRDRDCDVEHDINLGDDLPAQELIKQLALIKYQGGGDELETQIDSVLEVGRTTAWKSGDGARMVIILATSSDSKPARDGSDGAQAGKTLAALGIRVITIAPAGATNVHDIARHSGGESMALSNFPSADDLRRLRDRLTKSVTQMAGMPIGGGTVSMGPSFGKSGTVAMGSN